MYSTFLKQCKSILNYLIVLKRRIINNIKFVLSSVKILSHRSHDDGTDNSSKRHAYKGKWDIKLQRNKTTNKHIKQSKPQNEYQV